MAKQLSTLGVGTTFEVPVKSAYRSFLGDYVVFKMADKNHAGYPSGAITLITDKIIALLCSDAKEPSNSNSDRRNYGNNRHIHSNILQWLNSNAAAGQWYSAKHAQDAPPSSANVWDNVNPYDTWAGFLAMLDDDFVAALMTTTLTVAKNTVTDGGSYETFTAKMFLASTTEVGLANENGIAEGSKLALFSDNTSRLAYCTQAAIDKSNYSSDPTTSQAWYWWLRTPYSGDSHNVRDASTSGALIRNDASSGRRGVRPLCNLKSDILVSDNKNSRGNYEFQWNAAPSTPDGISVPESCYSTQNITVATTGNGNSRPHLYGNRFDKLEHDQIPREGAGHLRERKCVCDFFRGSSSSQSAARHFRTKRRSWNEKRRLLLQVHRDRSGQ